MKILVTGFKPFLDEKINPSELLSEMLAKKFTEVESLVLPVEFSNSFDVLKEKLNQAQYDYVIMLGQAAGRSKVSLEKIALNWVQTEHKDESGRAPLSGPILDHAPLAFMSEFPIDAIYMKLKEQSLPVEISFSAGTYVCNDLYFRVRETFNIKSVFIHVPLIKEQAQDRPYLELAQQENVLSSLISELL